MAGEAIPADSMVVPMWGAASQDPNVFENPREFDIEFEPAERDVRS